MYPLRNGGTASSTPPIGTSLDQSPLPSNCTPSGVALSREINHRSALASYVRMRYRNHPIRYVAPHLQGSVLCIEFLIQVSVEAVLGEDAIRSYSRAFRRDATMTSRSNLL